MVEIRSYSIDELEELTGVNPRTIAYYIKLGLLPKVGRRGRRTRYSQLFVSRLRFIERVKAMQDTGRLSTVTLPGIAHVIWHLVRQSGEEPDLEQLVDSEIQQLFESDAIPEKRLLGETAAGKPVTASFGPFGPYVRAGEDDGDPSASIEADEVNSISLEEALARIGEKQAEKEKSLIKEFEDVGIQIIDGPYGPYVRHRDVNAKIPASMDPALLTIEDCESLIDEKRGKLATTSASRRRDRLSSRIQSRGKTEIGTKLDLARSYIDMGDPGGARSILEEVLDEGEVESASLSQQQEYEALVGKMRERDSEEEAPDREVRPAVRRKPSVREDNVEEYSPASMELSAMHDESVSFSEEATVEPAGLRNLDIASISAQLGRRPDRLVQEIEHQVRARSGRMEGRTETWTRAPITANIEISVQGLDPEQADLVDSLATRIRKLLGIDHE